MMNREWPFGRELIKGRKKRQPTKDAPECDINQHAFVLPRKFDSHNWSPTRAFSNEKQIVLPYIFMQVGKHKGRVKKQRLCFCLEFADGVKG